MNMSQKSNPPNSQESQQPDDGRTQVEYICSIAEHALRTLEYPDTSALTKRKDLDISEVQIYTTATLCFRVIEHHNAIRYLVDLGYSCPPAVLLRTIAEAWLKFEGWADGKRDVREYVDQVIALRYYEISDHLKYDLPDQSTRNEINQEIASCSDFFDGEVPTRQGIVDIWDALVKDAFTDDAVKNDDHKRMKRLTLTYWSKYVHMSLYPKPDPHLVLYETGIAVVFMLHRAMQFCLEKDLLSDQGGKVHAQEVIDRCELYLGRKPHS